MYIEQTCQYFECDICFSKEIGGLDNTKPPAWTLITLKAIKGTYINFYHCPKESCKQILSRISLILGSA